MSRKEALTLFLNRTYFPSTRYVGREVFLLRQTEGENSRQTAR